MTNKSTFLTGSLKKLLLILAVFALFAASCGDDDDTDAADDAAADDAAADDAAADDADADDHDDADGHDDADDHDDDDAADDMGDMDMGAGMQMTADGESVCGLGNGEEATGEPILIGAVVTSHPAVDFSTIPTLASAYFDCVNDNGGIYGRPVQLIVENDELDPAKASAAAAKLIETDGVVAIASSTSILDCPINAGYYAEQGFNVIVAGVPSACFGSPNISAVNMGPKYSALGAAQAVVRAGDASGSPITKLVAVTNNVEGAEYNNTGVADLAADLGLEYEGLTIDTPITDGETVILDILARAGDNGGVTLTFIPPEMFTLMAAADSLGVIDDVIWGSATPANDVSVAAAAGDDWDGKLLINAEFQPVDYDGPDTRLYVAMNAEYAPDQPLASFGQMGFLSGRVMTGVLLDMGEGADINPTTVNAAIAGLKRVDSDMWCKPWYFGNLPGGNISNNWDITVVPDTANDRMRVEEDCFEIAGYDPTLAAVRAAEVDLGLGENAPDPMG